MGARLLVEGADEEAWWSPDRDYEPENPFETFTRLVAERHDDAVKARAEAARLKSAKESALKMERDKETARLAAIEEEREERSRLRELISKYPDEARHEL